MIINLTYNGSAEDIVREKRLCAQMTIAQRWALAVWVCTLYNESEALKRDCLTLAMRLYGEDSNTFAPETYEVMQRWGRICDKHIGGEREAA